MLSVGNSHHFRWLFWITVALLVLNLIDAILTLVWLVTGAAQEANPLMDTLVQIGLVPFVAVKLVIVSLGSFLLWYRRKRPAAVIGIVVLFLVYYFILLYHLRAMNLNLFERFIDYLYAK